MGLGGTNRRVSLDEEEVWDGDFVSWTLSTDEKEALRDVTKLKLQDS